MCGVLRMTSKIQNERHHLARLNFKVPFSLLAMSTWQRLGLACFALGILWVLVFWALGEVA